MRFNYEKKNESLLKKSESTNYGQKLMPALLALAATIGSSSAALATEFNFTYAPGTSLEKMLAFEMAGQIWSDHLADDATINIFGVPNIQAGGIEYLIAQIG